MPRQLSKTVTISDDIVDDVPTGHVHTILIDDDEPVPTTPEEVQELLARDLDATPAVMEVALEGVVKADSTDEETDETKVLLAALDALAVSKDVDAKAWTEKRLA